MMLMMMFITIMVMMVAHTFECLHNECKHAFLVVNRDTVGECLDAALLLQKL
jgi:hypothetical protein